ncbi:MAG: hypothetical protein ACK4NC_07355, partial [Candidatus Gracilibacteria bacterium]
NRLRKQLDVYLGYLLNTSMKNSLTKHKGQLLNEGVMFRRHSYGIQDYNQSPEKLDEGYQSPRQSFGENM